MKQRVMPDSGILWTMAEFSCSTICTPNKHTGTPDCPGFQITPVVSVLNIFTF